MYGASGWLGKLADLCPTRGWLKDLTVFMCSFDGAPSNIGAGLETKLPVLSQVLRPRGCVLYVALFGCIATGFLTGLGGDFRTSV